MVHLWPFLKLKSQLPRPARRAEPCTASEHVDHVLPTVDPMRWLEALLADPRAQCRVGDLARSDQAVLGGALSVPHLDDDRRVALRLFAREAIGFSVRRTVKMIGGKRPGWSMGWDWKGVWSMAGNGRERGRAGSIPHS